MADDNGMREAAHRLEELLCIASMVVGTINYPPSLETAETGNDESIGQQRDASEEFVEPGTNSQVLGYSKQQQQSLETTENDESIGQQRDASEEFVEVETNAQALDYLKQQQQSLIPYNYRFSKNNGVLKLQAGNREKDIEVTTGKESISRNYFKGCSGTLTTTEDDLTAADSLLLLQATPRYSEIPHQHFRKAITPFSKNLMNEEENHAQISHDHPEQLDDSYKSLDVSGFQNGSVNASFSFSSQNKSNDSVQISTSEGFSDSTVSDTSAFFSEEGEHTSNFENSRTTIYSKEYEFTEKDSTSPSLHQEMDANGIPFIVSDENDSGVSSTHMLCTENESNGVNDILNNTIPDQSLPTVEHNSPIKLTNHSSAKCNPNVKGDNAVQHNHEHTGESPLDLSSNSNITYHINPALLSNADCPLDISSVPALQDRQTSEVKAITPVSRNLMNKVENHAQIVHDHPKQLLREDDEKNKLQSILQRLHCPFVWKPDVVVSQDPNFRAQDNIVDYLTDKEMEFRSAKPNVFRQIVIRLVLSYEKAKAGRYQGAMKELELCHQILKEYNERSAKAASGHQTEKPKFVCDSTESVKNENQLYQWSKSSQEEDCFKDCSMREDSHKEEEKSAGKKEMEVIDPAEEDRLSGYWYVVFGSLAHILALSGDVNRALDLAQSCIFAYGELRPISKAAVVALHGAVFCEYGNEGNALGLKFLKKAVEMDPEYWQWNLNLGKVMGRLRRIYKSVSAKPDDEELQLLQKAVELRPQEAATKVHLANVYRGLASAIYREANAQGGPAVGRPTSRRQHYQSHEDYRRSHMMPRHMVRSAASDDYLSRAKKLYTSALAQEPDCPYNNARCAKGLWSMPYPFRDKEAAQKAILHALSIAPDDSLVNHYAGLFYEFNHDYDKALICYERATADGKNNFPAHMSYVSLRMKISPGNYSPLLLLDYILRKYTSPNNQIHTLCARAFYHKSEKQPMLAIRYFRKAIEVDPSHFTLKNFHPPSVFGYCGFTCDIYGILREMLDDLKHGRDYLKYKSIIDETEMFLDSIQKQCTSSQK